MANGLWRISFHTPADAGGGLIALKDGLIAGGDAGFTYVGSFDLKINGEISGNVHVQQYDQSASPIIPGATDYKLDFVGRIAHGQLTLIAHVSGNPALKLQIQGTKVRNI